jgi:preprotein translocase subunit SecA
MYNKLAGMTGTATPRRGVHRDLRLDIVTVPTNKPMRAQDLPDVVYKTRRQVTAP